MPPLPFSDPKQLGLGSIGFDHYVGLGCEQARENQRTAGLYQCAEPWRKFDQRAGEDVGEHDVGGRGQRAGIGMDDDPVGDAVRERVVARRDECLRVDVERIGAPSRAERRRSRVSPSPSRSR